MGPAEPKRIAIVERFGPFVSSRHLAARLRAELVEMVSLGQFSVIELDFDGVQSVSHSFADALIAVLAAQQGPEWLREHIRIRNLGSEERRELIRTVDARLRDRPSNIGQTG